jgi:hypothetical protein
VTLEEFDERVPTLLRVFGAPVDVDAIPTPFALGQEPSDRPNGLFDMGRKERRGGIFESAIAILDYMRRLVR